MSPAHAAGGRVTSVHPLWAIEGGRVTLEGQGFPIEDADGVPQVRIGPHRALLACASSTSLTAIVPQGLEGGQTAIRIDSLPGETAFVEIGAPLVHGVHQVDSPAYDRHGNLYVTFSGSRGQQAPVGIFVVRPDGTREPFVTDVPNPTSLAFGGDGRLYVSSRFDGSVYRVEADGRSQLFATLPASVAAFHLAFGPDDHLYVAAPTLNTNDPIYRIAPHGAVEPWGSHYGRPQGLAFDAGGHLYVVDALAGASAVYRVRVDAPDTPELMLSGGPLIGLAFDPHGGIALAATETVYRLAVGVRGLLP